MAYDKVVDSGKLDAAMTVTANKIRAGTGSSAKLDWDESNGFADSIPDLVDPATPSITVSSAGLITASTTQTAGIVQAGTKSATKQLSTQAKKTVTPGTSNQTAVASGKYTTGAITVKGDANLKAANIASGVSIFGVTGTLSTVATGSFEITDWVRDLTYTPSPFKITGLPFKPSRIIIYYDGLNNSNGGYMYTGVYTIDSSGWAFGIHNDPYYDEELDEDVDYYCWWHYFIKNSATGGYGDYLIVELTDDGVSIWADPIHEYAHEMRLLEGVYKYIAFS